MRTDNIFLQFILQFKCTLNRPCVASGHVSSRSLTRAGLPMNTLFEFGILFIHGPYQ